MNSKIDFYIKVIGDSDQVFQVNNLIRKRIDCYVENGYFDKEHSFLLEKSFTLNKIYGIKCDGKILADEFQNDDLTHIQLSTNGYEITSQNTINLAVNGLMSLFVTDYLNNTLLMIYYISEDMNYHGAIIFQKNIMIENVASFLSDNDFEEIKTATESIPTLKEWVTYCPIHRVRQRIISEK